MGEKTSLSRNFLHFAGIICSFLFYCQTAKLQLKGNLTTFTLMFRGKQDIKFKHQLLHHKFVWHRAFNQQNRKQIAFSVYSKDVRYMGVSHFTSVKQHQSSLKNSPSNSGPKRTTLSLPLKAQPVKKFGAREILTNFY